MAKNRYLSDKQLAIVKSFILSGKSLKSITEKVLEQGPAVTKLAIKNAWISNKDFLGKKKLAKREGAEMVRSFLESKKNADIEDMAALLETAIYRDILRRYVDADEQPNITTDQLLKLGISYRRLSATGRYKEKMENLESKLIGKLSIYIIDTIRQLSKDKNILPAEMEFELLKIISKEFNTDYIQEIESEKKLIERIRSIYASHNKERESDHRTVDGLAEQIEHSIL